MVYLLENPRIDENWGYPHDFGNPPIVGCNPPDIFASHQWICLIRNKVGTPDSYIGSLTGESCQLPWNAETHLIGGFNHQISTVNGRWWPQGMENQLTRWGVPEIGVPPNHPKNWTILVFKPMVLGISNFRKPPYWSILGLREKMVQLPENSWFILVWYHMCHKNC